MEFLFVDVYVVGPAHLPPHEWWHDRSLQLCCSASLSPGDLPDDSHVSSTLSPTLDAGSSRVCRS
eukprot:3905362-Rhodomonas_salina.2